jgi:hypothetical protein
MPERNVVGLSDDLLQVGSKPAPAGWRPSVEFDELSGFGEATTTGLISEPNFDEFLRSAGYDPEVYEVVGNTVKTSKWQHREGGDWLTSYRFTFRIKNTVIDLPLLYSQARKQVKPAKPQTTNKALMVLWSDLQVGKVDVHGGTEQLVIRCELMRERLKALVKREKPDSIVFADLGDTVENFGNAANLQQLRTNDLSIMQQVDVAITEAWLTLEMLYSLVPNITVASVGSNHCQWRVSKQAVGRPGVDDWGIFILHQIRRLAAVKEYKWSFVVPAPEDESVTLDVQGHKVALAHGHQSNRPDGVVAWWRGQQFGSQPAAHADILCTGHFHHLRVQECGAKPDGGSRFWVQAATLDNGSGWFRRTSGESAVPGLVCFVLEQGVNFTGSVVKL